MKERAFTYKVPIYEVYVTFVLTGDIKLAHAKFRIPYEEGNCAATGGESHFHDSNFYFFLNLNCLTHAFIAHEMAHVAHNVCAFIGITADHENDEAEAHLIYHLTEYFYKQLKRLKLVVADKPTTK